MGFVKGMWIACLVMIVAATVMAASLYGDDEPPLHEHPAIRQMHNEAIRQRESAGIKAHYELDEQCCQWAQQWANEMAHMGSMVHSSNAYAKGEIIAMGYSLPGAISAWKNSSGHWYWMGGRSSRAGWGYQVSANGTPYYCGCFRNETTPQPAWYKPRLVGGRWVCEFSDGTPRWFDGEKWNVGEISNSN